MSPRAAHRVDDAIRSAVCRGVIAEEEGGGQTGQGLVDEEQYRFESGEQFYVDKPPPRS